MKYRESKVPTVEAIHATDYSRRIEVVPDCLQGIRYTDRSEACLEPCAIFLMVEGDIDILAVCLDEEPHEETSKGVPSIPEGNK